MSKNKGKIIIFDSCSGGFGVLNHFLKWAGDYELIFVADYERNSFGIQTKEEICGIIESWFEDYISTLGKDSVKLVVIACNTASIASVSIVGDLEGKYGIPVVSMIDGFGLSLDKNEEFVECKNVGIFATKYSIESGLYAKNLYDHGAKEVFNIIGTNSEASVASGYYDEDDGKNDIERELEPFINADLDTIVLGCTCFELIKPQIKKVIDETIDFINPGYYLSEKAKDVLGVGSNTSIEPGQVRLLTTKLNDKSKKGIDNSSLNYFNCKLEISELVIQR